MSAGNFQYSKYQASAENGGGIYRIRVQPETLALTIGGVTNAPPAGDIDQRVTARTSASRRSFGVKPRTVTIGFTGAIPDGYSGEPISNIPLLTPAIAAAALPNATGTYLGAPIEVVGRGAESVR